MNDEGEGPLSVAEFVEYCRTQAGLLSGKVETVSEEIADLLDDLDAEMATLRDQLEGDGPATEAGAATPGPVGDDRDVEALQAREETLERKQSLAAAKQARLEVLQDLAAGYADLAADLESTVTDGQEALTRVVEFEAEMDAPAAFPDRQTVLEAAVESRDED